MGRRHRPRASVRLLCPKCLAPEVERDVLLFSGPTYHCRKCGYQGGLVLEQEEAAGAVETPGGGSTT